MYLVIVFLVAFVVLFAEDLYARKLAEKFVSKKMPTLPIIGSGFLLFFYGNILKLVTDYSNEFKEPYYFRVLFKDYYYTQRPEEIKEILTNPKTIEKGYVYSFLQWVVPDTILIAQEAIWKKKRRCLSKGFSQRRLKAIMPLLDNHAKNLVEKLHCEMQLPLLEQIEINLMENYMETMVGFNAEEADEEIKKIYDELNLYKHIKMVEADALNRLLKPWLYFDFIYFNTREGKHLVKMASWYNKVVKYIIQNRRKYMEMINMNHEDDESEKNLIDVMIEANLDERDISVETMLFGAAATETTGAVLGLTFTLLGMYPYIQEKVYKEVMEVCGGSESLDYTTLTKLKYTEMVLNETMRRFPAVPLIIRLTTSDLQLADRVIPKNTNIVLSIIDIHLSEKYWKNPLKYDPDRFLPEEVENRPPFTFLPFSSGPRNCIGVKFATIVAKTILANVIREFKLSSDTKNLDEIVLETGLTTVIKGGLHCNFTPRAKISI